MEENPYKILGVEDYSDISIVKKAYLKLANKHHPDKGGNVEGFIRIKKAYDDIVNGRFVVQQIVITYGFTAGNSATTNSSMYYYQF